MLANLCTECELNNCTNAWPTQMTSKPQLICRVLGSQCDTCGDHRYVGWQVVW